MLNLSTEKLRELIESVLTKHQWTQTKLAHELGVGPERVSRWKKGGGIHHGHHQELVRLLGDEKVEPITSPAPTQKLTIPFSVTIPRSSITVTTDKNGDINIAGLLVAELNRKEE